MHIWDVVTGNGQTVLQGRGAGVYAVAVSPDGTWLAVTGLDPVVQLWDIPAGKRRAVLAGHHGAVYAAAAAPDSSWLATGGRDGTVRIWDMAAARQRAVLTGHRGTVYTVAVAPYGRWLASGGSDGDSADMEYHALASPDPDESRWADLHLHMAWRRRSRLRWAGRPVRTVFDFLGGTGPLPASTHRTGRDAGHQ